MKIIIRISNEDVHHDTDTCTDRNTDDNGTEWYKRCTDDESHECVTNTGRTPGQTCVAELVEMVLLILKYHTLRGGAGRGNGKK